MKFVDYDTAKTKAKKNEEEKFRKFTKIRVQQYGGWLIIYIAN